MISPQQETNLAAATQRAKKKQDKTNPMVIHTTSGRLMPNTIRLRAHKDYRVYDGDINAPLSERMRWLEGRSKHWAPKVVNSKEAEDLFDVGTATIDELVIFAVEQWGAALDPAKPAKVLRKEVMALAEKHASDNPAQ